MSTDLLTGGLGWRFQIQTRVGFGWIPSSPAEIVFAASYSLYGHFDPAEMDSGFGRIRSRVGFGWIQADSWTPEMESANPAGALPLDVHLEGAGGARQVGLDVHIRVCARKVVKLL